MANYSIEDLEKDRNTQRGLGVAMGGSIAILLVKAFIDSGNNAKRTQKKQEIQYRINQINYEINTYRSKIMGGFFYSEEISRLEKEKKNLENELKSL